MGQTKPDDDKLIGCFRSPFMQFKYDSADPFWRGVAKTKRRKNSNAGTPAQRQQA
jgi:hypothetical protein